MKFVPNMVLLHFYCLEKRMRKRILECAFLFSFNTQVVQKANVR